MNEVATNLELRCCVPPPLAKMLGEDGGASSSAPSSSTLAGRAEFVSMTWEMVNAGHREIGWSDDGRTIVVSNIGDWAPKDRLRDTLAYLSGFDERTGDVIVHKAARPAAP